MQEISKATIARNVRKWRHDNAKRAMRVEVRQKASIGEEPSLNEIEVELWRVRRESAQFGHQLNLP